MWRSLGPPQATTRRVINYRPAVGRYVAARRTWMEARPGASPADGSADLGDRNGALQTGGARGRRDDLEGMDAGFGRDLVRAPPPAGGEVSGALEAQRLLAARDQGLLSGVDRGPGPALAAL